MMKIFGPRGTGRHRVSLVVAGTAALLCLLLVSAYAVLPGSPSKFEGGNDPTLGLGNMTVDTAGNKDWVSVTSDSAYVHLTDIASSTTDDSFTPGQKQDTTCPTIEAHGNPPKDDFTDVASFTEVNSTTGDTYLYGATIRYTANGNASENIELKQGTSGYCPGSTTLYARTAGDHLLAIDYLGGGKAVQFHVLTWVTSGACNVGSDVAPCWGATVNTLDPTQAEGGVNAAPITAANNPISKKALTAGQFAEFGVNLTTSGIIPANTCSTIAQTIWESRASGSSFVSTTKDITIENKTITNCGEIKIIKRTNPRGVDQNFSFTSTIAGGQLSCTADTTPTSFTLNDKDGATGDSTNNTEDCTNVPAGSYTVTEGANPTGFDFTSLTCTTGGSQDGTIARQANITLKAGDTVTCTYVNTQQKGAIKITKTSSKTANGLNGATFSITKGGTAITGSPFTTATVGGVAGVICVDNLAFGAYVVTETAAPTGFAIDNTAGQTVTVDNNAKCSDATYVGETQSFTDTPTADIQVRFRDGGSGETHLLSPLSCTNATGTSSVADTNDWNKTLTVSGIELTSATVTVTCTIVIDP